MPELIFIGGHSFTDGESALTHTSCLEEPHRARRSFLDLWRKLCRHEGKLRGLLDLGGGFRPSLPQHGA